MALPHYHTMPSYLADPVYGNLFEIALITPTLILQEHIYDQNINFISENSDGSVSSIIEMTFTFNQNSIKDWNTKDYLNDIGYVLLTIHDKIGNILSKELIEVQFLSSNVNFNYSGNDILSIQLRLENLGIEQNNIKSIDVIQKRLNRERKLNDLIGSI